MMTKNLIINDLTDTIGALEFDVESLQDTIENLNEKIGDLTDTCTILQKEKLNILADTDNYKKRLKKENETSKFLLLKEFILNLLPFIDNLELGLIHMKNQVNSEDLTWEDNRLNATYKGFKLALTSYIASLEKFDLEPFNSLGQEFNPSYHEAISTQKCPNIEKNIIIKEISKGYRLNKYVIRAAKVIVSI